MKMIAAYVVAWKLNLRKQNELDEQPRCLATRLRADYAGYGDNGTEAAWAIVNVENFR